MLEQLLKDRYSVRDYSDKPIEKEKLETIFRAAQAAPSAVNKQPVKVLVIESEPAKEKLRSITPMLFNAPMALLVGFDDRLSAKGAGIGEPDLDLGEHDAVIAGDHMMLQAADLGLGTVWVRGFNKDAIKEVLDLDPHFQPVLLLPIGYPSKKSKPNPMHFKNRSVEEMVEVL